MRAKLYKRRVERVEDTLLELVRLSERELPAPGQSQDLKWRRKSILEAARDYAAALRGLAKGV